MSDIENIQKTYREYYNNMLRNGKIPYGDTSHGIWGKSIIEEVYELFKQIKLGRYASFLDLGSGDGCVCAVASLFTKSTGIEGDAKLYKDSVNICNELGLDMDFINDDYSNFDLSKFDIIFIFPDIPFFRKLDGMLKGYKGKVIVYGDYFLPSNMNLIKDLRKSGINALLYK